MTRTELNRIALETVQQFLDYKKDMHLCHATDFAHALLVEIQKKLEVVGYRHTFGDFTQVIDLDEVEQANFQRNQNEYEPLTTLPIIEE